jgi:hypothetical protein
MAAGVGAAAVGAAAVGSNVPNTSNEVFVENATPQVVEEVVIGLPRVKEVVVNV